MSEPYSKGGLVPGRVPYNPEPGEILLTGDGRVHVWTPGRGWVIDEHQRHPLRWGQSEAKGE